MSVSVVTSLLAPDIFKFELKQPLRSFPPPTHQVAIITTLKRRPSSISNGYTRRKEAWFIGHSLFFHLCPSRDRLHPISGVFAFHLSHGLVCSVDGYYHHCLQSSLITSGDYTRNCSKIHRQGALFCLLWDSRHISHYCLGISIFSDSFKSSLFSTFDLISRLSRV